MYATGKRAPIGAKINGGISAARRKAKKRRHGKSFVCLVMLNIFMVAFFVLRLPVFADVDKYAAIVMLSVLFAYLFAALYPDVKTGAGETSLLSAFLVFGVVSYLISFYGLERLIGLADILMSVMLFRKYPLSRREKRRAYRLFLACAGAILLYGAIVERTGVTSVNTNTAGFLTAMVVCACAADVKRRRSFVSFAIAAAGVVLLFTVYQSRNALICAAAFVIIGMLLRADKKTFESKTVFRATVAFVIFAIVFAYVYAAVLFPKIGRGKITVLGKDIFSGRQGIWLFAFELLDGRIVWGAGGSIVTEVERLGLASVFTEMHNQPLGLIVGFGVIVFALFYLTFATAVCNGYKGKMRYDRAPAAFMFAVLLTSCFETYFFSPYTYIPVLIAYAIICGDGRRMIAKPHAKPRSENTAAAACKRRVNSKEKS